MSLWNTPIDYTKDPFKGIKIPKDVFKNFKPAPRSKELKERIKAFETKPTHIDTRLIY